MGMLSMNIDVIRILLSIVDQNSWKFSDVDITTAFQQSVSIYRIMYAMLPSEESKRSVLWCQTATAYGLADSERLWCLASENTFVEKIVQCPVLPER